MEDVLRHGTVGVASLLDHISGLTARSRERRNWSCYNFDPVILPVFISVRTFALVYVVRTYLKGITLLTVHKVRQFLCALLENRHNYGDVQGHKKRKEGEFKDTNGIL